MILDDLFVVLIDRGPVGGRCLRATMILDGKRYGGLVPVDSMEPDDVLRGLEQLLPSLKRTVADHAAGKAVE